MITLPNLGLVAWDDEEDEFEHSVLADNFVSIDEHDHAGSLSEPLEEPGGPTAEAPAGAHYLAEGKGKGIGTSAIKPESIWRYLIALNAVGHLQIGSQEVWRRNVKDKAIDTPQVEDEAIETPQIAEHAVTIDKLDPNILTLGTVVLWYKWSSGAKPGDLWAVMDGTAWANIPNDMGLTEGTIPDTRERFIRGTTQAKSDGTERGGNPAVNLQHHHNFNSGQLEHNHVVPGHSHNIPFQSSHNHEFEFEHETGTIRSRQNAFIEDLTLEGHRNLLESAYVGIGSLDHDGERVPGGFDVAVPMTQAGGHNHGGSTALSAAFGTSGQSIGSVNITTDDQLIGVDTTPPYIGFVHIMLVRNKGT